MTKNPHPETVFMIVAVTIVAAVALAFTPDPAPVRLAGQPAPAAWEIKTWAESHCDRCGKGLTADMQDGAYIIGGKPYWLHKGCVAAVTKAARR